MGFLVLQEIFGLALVGVATIFWVWMVIDCATKEPITGNSKVVWILIILLGSVAGAGIYYCIRRPQRQRQEEEEDEEDERLRRNPRPV
jgi:hypothetical protein